MCGEKRSTFKVMICSMGSPPRVRGKVFDKFADAPRKGITPACAGKSVISKHDDLIDRDHPRVCGEKEYR